MPLLTLIRNYLYSFMLIKHGEAYAKREYKSIFGVSLMIYHAALIGTLGMIQFRLKLHLLPTTKDFLSIVYIGIMLYLPYAGFLYFVFKNLPPIDSIDIEASLAPANKRIVIAFFIIGILLLFLTPYLISIIPSSIISSLSRAVHEP